MTDCCSNTACEIEKLQEKQTRILWAVLIINAAMFCIEIISGWLAGSTALLADSADMLGDALIYAFSIYVVHRNDRWKAISAAAKGVIMAVLGILVLSQAIYKLLHPELPQHEVIGGIGLLALIANFTCFLLLWSHRSDDINMRSVWLCSRNDIVANISVIFAALGVWVTATQWPDLIVGVGIAALVLHSSYHVLKDARDTYKKSNLNDK